jgi:hypothetical protein
MTVTLERHAVRVAVDASRSEQGLLVFVDGALVAVFSHLNETCEGDLKGCWFLEAGFGRCEYVAAPVLNSQEEAEGWVVECYSDGITPP